MNRISVGFLCVVATLAYCPANAFGDLLIDFEELIVTQYTTLEHGTGGYHDGYSWGLTEEQLVPWRSQGAEFNVGDAGPGWSYSNVVDTHDYGSDEPPASNAQNSFAAYPGSGADGSNNYALAYFSEFGTPPTITLPNGYLVNSMYVTNSTYAYWSMKNGDQFAKRFGGDDGTDDDYFKAIFTGLDELGAVTGEVEFYLADFRFADGDDDYIVDDWRYVDLTGLGPATSIQLSMESSDMYEIWMNTPAYIAIDNLSLTSVPEPGSVALLAGLTAAGGWWKRRRKAA